ncbi:MAG: 4-alpha-glucanotransferase [Cyanobacteria bacterium P01_H01_bin.74]
MTPITEPAIATEENNKPASEILKQLSEFYGLQTQWIDIYGNTHDVPTKTLRQLLEGLGISISSDEVMVAHMEDQRNPENSLRWIDYVLVPSDESIRYMGLSVVINWPAQFSDAFTWQLYTEGQSIPRSGTVDRAACEKIEGQSGQYRFYIPEANQLPQGYHQLVLSHPQSTERQNMRIVVTPTRCYLPTAMYDPSKKFWGPSVQLYAVNSEKSWGIGDFGDLKTLADWCGKSNAAMVGVNPLHSLFPHNPSHCSPYSPASRLFVNALNIAVESLEDYEASKVAQKKVQTKTFQKKLQKAQDAELVDYDLVAELKLPVLKLVYKDFVKAQILKETVRGKAFLSFVECQGRSLRQFATYMALQQHFYDNDNNIWGWQAWPEEYQTPDSEAVLTFLSTHYNDIEFYMYLQWLADCQLNAVHQTCQKANMPIGLYLDMAVGVDRSGADVWANQGLFMASSSIGAPPDEYNPMGQDWGLPPIIPQKLRAQQFDYFITMVQQNMKNAGALRIDHIMAMMRLFLIPPEGKPGDGGYLHYPMDEMFGILALESQRNQCMVIGEDMGTVSDVVRERMQSYGIFSYKVFCFEKNAQGFKLPEDYYQDAVVAISTHDLPTLYGYWSARDQMLRTDLDLYPTEALREAHIQERKTDRPAMLGLLKQYNLLPEGVTLDEGVDYHNDPKALPPMTQPLMRALHQLVSKSKTRILTIQFEDVLGQEEQINLPGVSNPVYPCWKRKLTQPLETLMVNPDLAKLAEALHLSRM